MSHSRYFTAKDVATMLRLNLLTIYEYIRSGQLKALHFGRNYRIAENDLHEFLNAHRVVKGDQQ